jgi:putative aldouronate transport system substrate-binding protein
MKKKLVRMLSVLLVLTAFAGLISGCGAERRTQTSGASTKESTSKEDANTAGAPDPTELRISVFDREIQGQTPVDNNYWTKWIQEKFGDLNNITLKFVPIPRLQEVDKLNVLMASSTAPDIIFTYNGLVAYNYFNQGGLTEIDGILDEYGKKLKEYLGEQILSYGKFSGKQYLIPAKRVFEGSQASYIRKDWLDKLGLDVPKTKDEAYNYLKLVKEKDPGELKGKAVPLGLSLGLTGSRDCSIEQPTIMPVVRSFITTDPTSKDFFVLPECLQPGYKEGVRFLNKLYGEGLMSSDFALDKENKVIEADISNGKVGMVNWNVGQLYMENPGLIDKLKANVPGAEMVPCDPWTNADGKRPKLLYDPYGLFIMIPKCSINAVAAIKYLDWMANPDVIYFLQNGEENVHYTLNEGLAIAKNVEDERKMNVNANIDYTLIVNGKDFGDMDKSIKGQALSYAGYEDMAMETFKHSLTDGYYSPNRIVRPILAEVKYNMTLYEQCKSMYIKSIIAKPEDFDRVYDEEISQYIKKGGQAVIEERKVAYKELNPGK